MVLDGYGIFALGASYFAAGWLLASTSWYEAYEYVEIDWAPFLAKLFLWPIYPLFIVIHRIYKKTR